MTPPLRFSAAVTEARRAGHPVVALESTIITHGMPYPRNVETALGVEDVIRRNGATPATIAVMDGHIRIGLDPGEIEALAQAKDVMKVSRADMAFAIAARRTGATTVAATMISAALAGIEVFATGGIGGVHRGAETDFDISADLLELARTPVNVVAAGAKAILDIPKTLEILETQGVPVIAYGQDGFPAFWSRESGLSAPLRADDVATIAQAFRARRALGLSGGQLIANPIPATAEIPAATLAPLIDRALADARTEGITAKAVTPYVLGRVFDLTEGASLEANIALVRNNAALAADLAKALNAG